MNTIKLKDCITMEWYEVVEGFGIIENGETIQYINNFDKHFVIGETYMDERGISINCEDAEKIIVKPIIF